MLIDHMKKKDRKIKKYLFFIGIFVFLYIFYTQLYPLTIQGADDWTYIGYFRGKGGLPVVNGWNPARILPEVLFPSIAGVAVFVVYPVTHDYVGSITIMCALTLSLVITVYIYSFYKLIHITIKLSHVQACAVSFLFFLFHYIMFIDNPSNNHYLFEAVIIGNNIFVTNCFYYTIPTLLNLILVMYFMCNDTIKNIYYYKEHPIRGGGVLLLIYLVVFSNLYSSYILAIYVSVNLVIDIATMIRYSHKCVCTQKYKNVLEWLKHKFLFFLILCLWIISALFEATGGNARSLTSKLGLGAYPYFDLLEETLRNLKDRLCTVNKKFILVVMLLMIVFLIVIWKSDTDEEKCVLVSMISRITLCGSLSIIFLILFGPCTAPRYISRMDVLLGPCAFLFLWCGGAIGYLLKRFSSGMLLIPFVSFALIFSIVSQRDKAFVGLNSQLYTALNNYYIEQFLEADAAGLTEFTLNASSGAPDYLGERIATTLYKHRIVSRHMNVTTNESLEVDEMFGLR